MRKLIFKKGIYTINLPFLLDNFSPWQDQIEAQLNKCKKTFTVRKSARWGFAINEYHATIKCYKN